eukprot:1016987-Rhodomonas_salina.1
MSLTRRGHRVPSPSLGGPDSESGLNTEPRTPSADEEFLGQPRNRESDVGGTLPICLGTRVPGTVTELD